MNTFTARHVSAVILLLLERCTLVLRRLDVVVWRQGESIRAVPDAHHARAGDDHSVRVLGRHRCRPSVPAPNPLGDGKVMTHIRTPNVPWQVSWAGGQSGSTPGTRITYQSGTLPGGQRRSSFPTPRRLHKPAALFAIVPWDDLRTAIQAWCPYEAAVDCRLPRQVRVRPGDRGMARTSTPARCLER